MGRVQVNALESANAGMSAEVLSLRKQLAEADTLTQQLTEAKTAADVMIQRLTDAEAQLAAESAARAEATRAFSQACAESDAALATAESHKMEVAALQVSHAVAG